MPAESSPPPSGAPPTEAPFYGWRYLKRRLPDGTEYLEEVELTLEDVLHPEEDDVIPERPLQEIERGYLAWVFRTRLHGLSHGLVLSDCLVNFGVEDLRSMAPDVSVFEGVTNPPDLEKGTFY